MSELATAEPWLRPAGAADSALLADIHAEAFPKSWTAREMETTLGGFGAVGLIAGYGRPAEGMLMLRAVAGEAEVLTLAVRTSARRRGLALALVAAAAVLARTAGAASLWLEVAEDNTAACALYVRAGFTLAGRRPRYYARPDGLAMDALLMRRALNTDGA